MTCGCISISAVTRCCVEPVRVEGIDQHSQALEIIENKGGKKKTNRIKRKRDERRYNKRGRWRPTLPIIQPGESCAPFLRALQIKRLVIIKRQKQKGEPGKTNITCTFVIGSSLWLSMCCVCTFLMIIISAVYSAAAAVDPITFWQTTNRWRKEDDERSCRLDDLLHYVRYTIEHSSARMSFFLIFYGDRVLLLSICYANCEYKSRKHCFGCRTGALFTHATIKCFMQYLSQKLKNANLSRRANFWRDVYYLFIFGGRKVVPSCFRVFP